MNEHKINLISECRAELIVLLWEKDRTNFNELYLANSSKGTYIAIDNMSGECFVEEFKSIHCAIDWLLER